MPKVVSWASSSPSPSVSFEKMLVPRSNSWRLVSTRKPREIGPAWVDGVQILEIVRHPVAIGVLGQVDLELYGANNPFMGRGLARK